jgi:threonine dehydrogenase-like Zn-dependent dehydrogenase
MTNFIIILDMSQRCMACETVDQECCEDDNVARLGASSGSVAGAKPYYVSMPEASALFESLTCIHLTTTIPPSQSAVLT